MSRLVSDERKKFRGRGAVTNPTNRFEKTSYVRDEEAPLDESTSVPTELIPDKTKTILATNDSPDVGFDTSINVYRGCEHGCVYCFARPTHEYLGYSSGLDFETKIIVKYDAPEMLREALMSKKYEPKVIGMSGVTDCYQPIEKKLELTRRCLAVLAEFRNPVMIITKNALVTRDIDLLSELATHDAAAVFVSITTLDPDLARIMEPRTSSPQMRLDAVRKLTDAGIPVGVLNAPVIPAINDHEMPAVLAAAKESGAVCAGYTMLRLPWQLKSIFENWLETHFPDRREKVLHRIQEMRGGKMYEAEWGKRMKGEGVYAEQMNALFHTSIRRAGLNVRDFNVSTAAFKRPEGAQKSLF